LCFKVRSNLRQIGADLAFLVLKSDESKGFECSC
jgi:hypothetical protein